MRKLRELRSTDAASRWLLRFDDPAGHAERRVCASIAGRSDSLRSANIYPAQHHKNGGIVKTVLGKMMTS